MTRTANISSFSRLASAAFPAGRSATVPDGHSLWPGFTNVPNEFIEAYFPLRIMKYETIPDSGGAGLHRGGNGLSVAYEFLADGQIAIHDERWLTYPWGVRGGDPGMRSTKRMVRTDGREEWLPAKCDGIRVKKGDVLYFNTWGGGGWGKPMERDPAEVLADVKRGLVTAEGAKRYGVVLDGRRRGRCGNRQHCARRWKHRGRYGPVQPRWQHRGDQGAGA